MFKNSNRSGSLRSKDQSARLEKDMMVKAADYVKESRHLAQQEDGPKDPVGAVGHVLIVFSFKGKADPSKAPS